MATTWAVYVKILSIKIKDTSCTKAFVAFAVLWFFLIKGYLILGPYQFRHGPVEFDDAHVYLLQAKIAWDCILEECSALDGFAHQMSEVDTKDWAWLKLWHKVLGQASLGFGFILGLAESVTGLTLMEIHFLTQCLGLVLAAVSLMAIFNYLKIGRIETALCFIFLAFDINPNTTWLQIFTPSNFALILATILVLNRAKMLENSKYMYYLLLIILLSLHPISIVYFASLYILVTFVKIQLNSFKMVEFLLVFVAFAYYSFSSNLELSINSVSQMNLIDIIIFNGSVVFRFLEDYASASPIHWMMVFGMVYYALRQRWAGYLILKIIVILLVTLGFYFHNSPGQLFFRTWDLLLPFILGLGLAGCSSFLTKYGFERR